MTPIAVPSLREQSGRTCSRALSHVLASLGFLLVAAGISIPPAVWFSTSSANAQTTASQKLVVYCVDERRGNVSRIKADQCRGRIVSAEEAEKIKDARASRLKAILGRKPDNPFPKLQRASHGTGFFISEQGYMMTNNHVIRGCTGVSVETTTGKKWKAAVVSTLETYDLALLKVSERPPEVAEFSPSSFVELEQRADLIGYPTQGIAPIQPFFTPATRSGHFGRPGDRGQFRIRGDVRGGNSGGPVLDASGRVIGVIFAQLNSVLIAERTGQVPDDTGFAVANEIVFSFLERNGVRPRIASTRQDEMPREAVFARSRALVARIGCWK